MALWGTVAADPRTVELVGRLGALDPDEPAPLDERCRKMLARAAWDMAEGFEARGAGDDAPLEEAQTRALVAAAGHLAARLDPGAVTEGVDL